jgi:branched-chain amino acid aminotransferase
MVMPQVPQELFMQGLTELVKLDKEWIPDIELGSLYIRPFMFATDDFIGVKPSDKYCFAIFTCPVGPYYSKPLKVKVEEVYSRAAPGGVGFTKCAGNYGGALYPTKIAQEEGFDQVLWTDPVSHTLVEETGTTNFFAVFNDKIVTPSLRETMLAGITRDSVIKVLNSVGYNVEERGLTVEELVEGITNGTVKEMFITGTAATLIHVTAIGYRGKTYELNESADHTATEMVTNTLKAIRTGELPDIAGWMTAI